MNALTINNLTLTATDLTASEGAFDVTDQAGTGEILTGRLECKKGRHIIKVEDAHTSVDVKITAAQRREIEAWIESHREQPEVDPVDQILADETESAVEQIIEPAVDPELNQIEEIEPLLQQQEISFETKLAIEAVAAIASLTRENLTAAGTDVPGTIDAAIKALSAVRATKRPAAKAPRASNGPTCNEQVLKLIQDEPMTVAELTKKTGRYYSQVLSVVNKLIEDGVACKVKKKIGFVVDSF